MFVVQNKMFLDALLNINNGDGEVWYCGWFLIFFVWFLFFHLDFYNKQVLLCENK
jgi:hypothetical protein